MPDSNFIGKHIFTFRCKFELGYAAQYNLHCTAATKYNGIGSANEVQIGIC